MTQVRLAFGPVLILLGIVFAAPEVVLVGLLALLAVGVTELWTRFGLRSLNYERTLGRDRTVWGEDIPLDLSVWNDKALPVPWLSVDDGVSAGVALRDEPLTVNSMTGAVTLRSRWTVGWYERVTRHLRLASDRRGQYFLGPVHITVADLFGYGGATKDQDDRASYLVRPRTLPVRLASQRQAPAGDLRTRHSLFEDPSLFAGVRPYRAGDPMKRVHWRATARTGVPVSKRFDPTRAQNVMVALDVQVRSGYVWANDEELVECLMVAASSLVRYSLLEGASCGLAAMATSHTMTGLALVAPRTGRDQLSAIADLLGRLNAAPSAPFERLLVRLPQSVGVGTTILVVTARDPEPYAVALKRLDRLGYPVQVIGLGPNGHQAVARARAYGFSAMTGSLTPDWRTSDALVLAS
jgi:uncharacterized protein (DUF58 family)